MTAPPDGHNEGPSTGRGLQPAGRTGPVRRSRRDRAPGRILGHPGLEFGVVADKDYGEILRTPACAAGSFTLVPELRRALLGDDTLTDGEVRWM